MNDKKEVPYIRWYVPRWRRGPPKIVEVSRRNWLVRILVVILMWAIIIAFFGLLEGAELAILLTFIAILVGGGIVFYGWYSGREGVGKEPASILSRNKNRKA